MEPIKYFATELRAINFTKPDQPLETFAGPHIPASSLEMARTICEQQVPYLLVIGEVDAQPEPVEIEPAPTEEPTEEPTEPTEQPVPVEETPVEETPVEETPVEETPVEETPVEETPTDEVEPQPVEETPAEQPQSPSFPEQDEDEDEEPSIKPGDVVVLRSGSHAMTVRRVRGVNGMYVREEWTVEVVFAKNGDIEVSELPYDSLVVVTKS